MRWLRFAVLLLVWLASGCPGRAQDPFREALPAMRTFGGQEGLPGDSVYHLMLDRRGDLWVGAMEGAARFNGRRWVGVSFPKEARSQQVRTLLESHDGSLWFGTQDGGVWRLKEGAWQSFVAGEALPSNRINCLLETEERGERTLWVGTAGGGIARFRGGVWTRPDGALGLGDAWIWKLRAFTDPDGSLRIWACTQGGLWTLSGGRWSRIGRAQGFLGPSVNDLVEIPGEDGRPQLWASCWGMGLARWDGRRWDHFGPAEGFPSRFPTSLCVSRDAHGKPVLWVGTFDEGVAWLEGHTWSVLSPQRGLPVVGAYAMAAVPGGKPSVWVGTRGAGVIAIDLAGWRTMDLRGGMPGAEVKSFCEFPAPDGTPSFWVGTTRGTARWSQGRWQPETFQGKTPYCFQLATAPDARGQPALWAATLSGLLRWEAGRWILEPSPVLPRSSTDVLLKTELAPGKPSLWAGFSAGLARLQDGRWSFFTTADGLPGNWILSLCTSQDRDGGRSLWVGTRGQGVGRFKEGRWTVFGAGSGLPALSVQALLATHGTDGRAWIWAGTRGGGLARLEADRPGALWEAVPLGEDRTSVVGLLADGLGRLYIATTRGILRCPLQEHQGVPWPGPTEHFSTGDGLPTDTIQDNALYQDRQGRIWLGTVRGAAVLDPTLEREPPVPPDPRLEAVEAQGRRVKLDEPLDFRHNETRLVFHYALPTFHRREDTRFRTWIQGLEEEPTPWQVGDFRELTRLPGGSYTLLVWARDFKGREVGPLQVPFLVRSAPWKSGWAYGIYVLVLCGAVAGFVRVRTAFLRRRQQALEKRVRAAMAEVKTLQGLLPICAYCKKIRDDQGAWDPLEHYLGERSDVTFSHGVCPDCSARLREELKGLGKGP